MGRLCRKPACDLIVIQGPLVDPFEESQSVAHRVFASPADPTTLGESIRHDGE